MDFETQYNTSLINLDFYIGTQVTPKQVASAKHHKRHLEMNKSFFQGIFEEGELLTCQSCGTLHHSHYYEPSKSQIISTGLCFHCNHWYQIAHAPKKKTSLIIDGETYSDGGNRPNEINRSFLGHGGSKFKIRQDGKEWETNNLWHGGTIPEEYRHLLVDNAEFLK